MTEHVRKRGRDDRPRRAPYPPPRPAAPHGPRSAADLRRLLLSINRKPYGAYRDIVGEYHFPRFTLAVVHVQADPFASPSRLLARVPLADAGFPDDLVDTPVHRLALADYLTRRFAAAIRRYVRDRRGLGHTGLVAIDVGGQEVLERTACQLKPDAIEVRFVVGLPAEGRTVLGGEAVALLVEELPRVVEGSLFADALDLEDVRRHLAVVEDYYALRDQLTRRGLVAFVAEGAVLPRESGASDRPLRGPQVVPFTAPPELRTVLQAPHRGNVVGMGLPAGVTLIVGGGFHGKSTLLNALVRGVYPHIPGDGREYVVTLPNAVQIRAEDGRNIEQVDISPFIKDLPLDRDTRAFSTPNASGSTSQAANIIEALEVGTSLLLIDEDTSATNFMIRDARMQRLIPDELEPITPFIDQVQNLAGRGVSTVLVIGGSGDYFDVADHVIAMHEYRPSVVTARAHAIARELPSQRLKESPPRFGTVVPRAVLPESLDPSRRGRTRIVARGTRALEFGATVIDLGAIEQLIDESQTRAIGDLIAYALRKGYLRPSVAIADAIARALADVDRDGLDVIAVASTHVGDYARPRPYEVAATLNRLRGVRFKQLR